MLFKGPCYNQDREKQGLLNNASTTCPHFQMLPLLCRFTVPPCVNVDPILFRAPMCVHEKDHTRRHKESTHKAEYRLSCTQFVQESSWKGPFTIEINGKNVLSTKVVNHLDCCYSIVLSTPSLARQMYQDCDQNTRKVAINLTLVVTTGKWLVAKY